jgi:hypothetical protein
MTSDIKDKYPILPTRSPLNMESKGNSIEFEGKELIRKPSQINLEDYDNKEHETNRNMFN